MKDKIGKVVKRIYVKVPIKLETPLIIGSGDSHNADIEVLKDSKGIPFIPASSIAGVFRDYIEQLSNYDKDIIGLMFGKDYGDYTMSCINIYDGFFVGDYKLSIRDGVKLNKRKASVKGSKYDYEILETGASFILRMELVIRDSYSMYENYFKRMLAQILYGLEKGEIFLGAKANRGFGYISIDTNELSMLELDFKKDNNDWDKWINFDWENFLPNIKSYMELCDDNMLHNETLYNRLVAEINICSSILIRQYSKFSEGYPEVDYEHIKCNGKPVIPGTSWVGTIRQSSIMILEELHRNSLNVNVDKIIKDIFGYVQDEEDEKASKASLVKIRESVIVDGHEKTRELLIQRVRIDRFTGGAMDTGLYNEKPLYFGRTKLEILIRKNNDYVIGLLLLVLKELNAGIVAIGGETSIGRGLVRVNSISLDGEDVNDEREKRYLRDLLNYLRGGN